MFIFFKTITFKLEVKFNTESFSALSANALVLILYCIVYLLTVILITKVYTYKKYILSNNIKQTNGNHNYNIRYK